MTQLFHDLQEALEKVLEKHFLAKSMVLDFDVKQNPSSPDQKLFEIRGRIFNPWKSPPSVYTATGQDLDEIARDYGLERYKSIMGKLESDEALRERIADFRRPQMGRPVDLHEGHEIIENHANGKIFKYCRNCKTEVF